MAQVNAPDESLFNGMRMEREEFMRRWEAIPDLKNAELIDGTVHVSSPVSEVHSDFDGQMAFWLRYYAARIRSLKVGHNATCYLLESAPQPDVYLRTTEQDSAGDAKYLQRAPELIVEVCESTYAHDLGPKKALYQRAGVREYITVNTFSNELIWRYLDDSGSYITLEPDTDGILRSRVFRGLWLNPAHVWSHDDEAIMALLDQARATL